VASVEASATTEEAAKRLRIAKATARPQGQPPGSKLDPHSDFIFSLVEERSEIFPAEIA